MLTASTEKLCGIATGGYFGPAEVCEIQEDSIYLAIPHTAQRLRVAGTLAIPGITDIRVGTRVLAAAQHMDDVYIIGVLETGVPTESETISMRPREITLSQRESLRILSEDRELLFEHDASNHVTRVHVPKGDLEFIAEDGNIRFETSGAIQLRGTEAVQVSSENAIRLGVEDEAQLARSEYVLGTHDQRIETPQLRLRAANLDAQTSTVRFTSQTLRGRFGSIRIVAQTIESVADTLIQKARNSFARVSALWHVKADSISQESTSSMHLNARNTTLKSREDMKIDGQQIHLG